MTLASYLHHSSWLGMQPEDGASVSACDLDTCFVALHNANLLEFLHMLPYTDLPLHYLALLDTLAGLGKQELHNWPSRQAGLRLVMIKQAARGETPLDMPLASLSRQCQEIYIPNSFRKAEKAWRATAKTYSAGEQCVPRNPCVRVLKERFSKRLSSLA